MIPPEVLRSLRKKQEAKNKAPATASADPEQEPAQKRRKLVKTSDKDRPAPPAPIVTQTSPISKSTRSASAAASPSTARGKRTEAPPQSDREPTVTRRGSGVHPGPITGVGIGQIVADKRPCSSEQDAYEVYFPLVPPADAEEYLGLSGADLVKKACQATAQVDRPISKTLHLSSNLIDYSLNCCFVFLCRSIPWPWFRPRR